MSRTRFVPASALVCTLALVAPLAAQEEQKHEGHGEQMEMASMEAYEQAGTPGAPHAALADKLAGEWNVEVKMWMGPGEPMTTTATSTNEMILDGRFIRYQVSGDFMGQPFKGIGTTGYNNTAGRYEATWIDNHSTTTYFSTGQMEDGKLVMTSEHMDPASGEMIKGRSVMRFVSDDQIVEEAWEIRDGQEVKTMELTYTRKM